MSNVEGKGKRTVGRKDGERERGDILLGQRGESGPDR